MEREKIFYSLYFNPLDNLRIFDDFLLTFDRLVYVRLLATSQGEAAHTGRSLRAGEDTKYFLATVTPLCNVANRMWGIKPSIHRDGFGPVRSGYWPIKTRTGLGTSHQLPGPAHTRTGPDRTGYYPEYPTRIRFLVQ